MVRATVIELIADDPSAHGVFDGAARTYRKVLCTVQSLTRSEAYQAMSQGLNPSYVFVLRNAAEYREERLLKYRGTVYRIYRTYMKGDGIELTAERLDSDV